MCHMRSRCCPRRYPEHKYRSIRTAIFIRGRAVKSLIKQGNLQPSASGPPAADSYVQQPNKYYGFFSKFKVAPILEILAVPGKPLGKSVPALLNVYPRGCLSLSELYLFASFSQLIASDFQLILHGEQTTPPEQSILKITTTTLKSHSWSFLNNGRGALWLSLLTFFPHAF